ncbi:hypothetical protein [Erythrobacter sp. HKB08]|nr:hypothetical protein [Erythrobacter sp. HKB08]
METKRNASPDRDRLDSLGGKHFAVFEVHDQQPVFALPPIPAGAKETLAM